MNLYFLVEGKRTEFKVYPKWLEHLIPELKRVNHYTELNENNYFLFNGNGFPSLLDNHLVNAIADVNSIGNVDYLCIILDAEENSIQEKNDDILAFMQNHGLQLVQTQFKIIVQNKCIETWFLANKRIYKSNPEDLVLVEYLRYYNVSEKDPELMPVYNGFNTTAQFHLDYCKKYLKERNIRYTKVNPGDVSSEHYLNQLILRNKTDNHILSFKQFIDFCHEVRLKINN
jgi:hypothetical protein